MRQKIFHSIKQKQHILWPMLAALLLAYGSFSNAAVQAPFHASTATGQPTGAVAGGSWKPQIAFGYSGTGTAPDAEFLAENLSWLMLKYSMEDYRQQIYDAGYAGPMLQYQTTFQILGPGPYTSRRDTCVNDYTPVKNNPMWSDDFCELVHSHESWFLHNGAGERLYKVSQNWDGTPIVTYYMNPATAGFRKFWVAQAKRQDAGWQAYFLDNVAVNFAYLRTEADNQDGVVKEYNSKSAWQSAEIGLIRHIKRQLPDVKLWGNMIEGSRQSDDWDAFLPYLNGFQDESFATGWVGRNRLTTAEWLAGLERAEKVLAKNKAIVLQSQGLRDDLDRMRFSLASYLLIATESNKAVFRYTYNKKYSELWWYPEYELDLGKPLGPRYQQDQLWVRDFGCGRVTVDPATYVGTIEVGACQTGYQR